MDWLSWIPDPAILDVWVWALLVVPAVVLGVPLILSTVRVPRRLEFEEVPDEELSDDQLRWFTSLGDRLREVGFEPAATFRAPTLPSLNLSRAFVNGRAGSVACAMAIRDERPASVLSDNLLEITSEFGDGTFVNTRSRAITDLFDPVPGYQRHIHLTRDPLALHRHHERHCRERTATSARSLSADRVLPRLTEFHERWIAHQMQRGLLRERDTKWCGATVRLALCGVVSFFNPFGDRFSLARLLAGLAAGLAAPLLAALALSQPNVQVVSEIQSIVPMSNHLAEILALAPVLLAGAASVGWIFESRAVVWAPLFASLAGWLTLPAATPDPAARAAWLVVLIGTTLVANSTSNSRHRRQALV